MDVPFGPTGPPALLRSVKVTTDTATSAAASPERQGRELLVVQRVKAGPSTLSVFGGGRPTSSPQTLRPFRARASTYLSWADALTGMANRYRHRESASTGLRMFRGH